MVQVYLPRLLLDLFPEAPRRVELEAASVGELLEGLNQRWPGMRDRLSVPGAIRAHINVFVDGERSAFETRLQPDAVVQIIPAVSGG
jgi:molybdopterin converting factor small subunit